MKTAYLLFATLLILIGVLIYFAYRDYDCSDFKNQESAQQMLQRYPTDPYHLDRDHNGIACEALLT